MKKISERLKEYRFNHNLTQSEMAKVLGVSVTTYNLLENERNPIPNTVTVDKISKLLKVSVKTVRESLVRK